MGYTNYWERTEKPITQEFVNEVKRIIEESERLDITIRGWKGEGNPTVTLEEIQFNGNGAFGLDHETFRLNNEKTGFAFCKTVRKPYDWTVKKVLAVATDMGLVTDVSDDGEIEHLNDKQWLYDQFNSLVKRLMR